VLTNSIFYQEAMVKIPVPGFIPPFVGGPGSAVPPVVNQANLFFLTSPPALASPKCIQK
jgi:hypothetical protein